MQGKRMIRRSMHHKMSDSKLAGAEWGGGAHVTRRLKGADGLRCDTNVNCSPGWARLGTAQT